MIVVDTNILAYLYTPSDFGLRAERLLQEDDHWAAPILWRSEFRNILAGQIRRGMMTVEQALAIQQDAEALLARDEHLVDSAQVLELVRISPCSAYDCEFVALAKSLGTRLYTMDGKVLRTFPEVAFPLPELTKES